MRLFAAIRPPAQVLEHLNLALSVHRNGIGGQLRWAPDEQLHITVAFFPEVPSGAVGEVARELVRLTEGFDPLRLAMRGAGTFAGRTLWTGVAGDTEPLADLMAAGSRMEYADPRDVHRAHLTVARPSRRSHGTDLATIVHALAVYAGPEWVAESVELYSSQLGKGRGGGPLHEWIESAPFRQ
ncbi:RNA 2',3'-cyclic phosphodiesterase [Nakamurella lactea]|uniref:RNA 2',3'-cyclic phosphodiesterase n=1 Tax=Nakamurella lactea TaxID=459515 RepID=UPI000421F271|nr:RNA 2',3'-cyclic phosphodiesterase [Nakamurella lactea]